MASSFIPNSFQTPNAYVDRLMPYLTDPELRVLLYAARRIFGFQKRQDNIAISQFVKGIQAHDGTQLDEGAGVSIDRARKALAGLIQYRVMKRIEKNDPKVKAGDLYELVLDDAEIDWEGLAARREALRQAGRAKIARSKAKKESVLTVRTQKVPSDGQNGERSGGQNGVRSDGQKDNNQGNPVEIQLITSAKAPEPETPKQPKTPKKPTTEKEDPPLYTIAQALALVTCMDFEKNKARLFAEAKRHYSLEDVPAIKAGYGAGSTWYATDWRGRQGQPPTLAQIRETWAVITSKANPANGSLQDLAARRAAMIAKIEAAQAKKAAAKAAAEKAKEAA